MSPEQVRALVVRWIEEVYEHGDVELAEQLAAPEFAAVARHNVTWIKGSFPDAHFEIEEVVVEGERAMVRWTFTGTHTASWLFLGMRIEPTGRRVTFTGIDSIRIVDGRIVEEQSNWNETDVLGQLGVFARGHVKSRGFARYRRRGPRIVAAVRVALGL